jgi:hypothetical protein
MFDLSGIPAATREHIQRSCKYRALFARWPEQLLGIDTARKRRRMRVIY